MRGSLLPRMCLSTYVIGEREVEFLHHRESLQDGRTDLEFATAIDAHAEHHQAGGRAGRATEGFEHGRVGAVQATYADEAVPLAEIEQLRGENGFSRAPQLNIPQVGRIAHELALKPIAEYDPLERLHPADGCDVLRPRDEHVRRQRDRSQVRCTRTGCDQAGDASWWNERVRDTRPAGRRP